LLTKAGAPAGFALGALVPLLEESHPANNKAETITINITGINSSLPRFGSFSSGINLLMIKIIPDNHVDCQPEAYHELG
jgi:hypothetical protein